MIFGNICGKRRRLTKAQVSAVHDPPPNETTDSRQVDQPTKNGCSTAGNSHEGQEGEERLTRTRAQFTIGTPKRKEELTQKATEMNGRPPFVTLLKILGAWPRMDRPNKTREEEYRKLFPAEKALVRTAALMMCGRTLIPARLMAMTYGLRGRKVRFKH